MRSSAGLSVRFVFGPYALRSFGRRITTDLIGLNDQRVLKFDPGRSVASLLDLGMDYVVVFPGVFPELIQQPALARDLNGSLELLHDLCGCPGRRHRLSNGAWDRRRATQIQPMRAARPAAERTAPAGRPGGV